MLWRALTLGICIACLASSVEARVWTDITGKYRAEAEMVGLEADGVRLRDRRGNEKVVPLHKLSVKDRQFAQAAHRAAQLKA